MNVWNNGLSDWSDIMRMFHENMEAPDEVIFASYDYEYAYVVYRVGDLYYVVEASHCSCYNLEDQWLPEEYTREALKAVIGRQVSNENEVHYKCDDPVARGKFILSKLEKV